MILDAGALIPISRNDRAMIARLVAAEEEGDELRTHPMVVAQVWRDGRGRQALLARLLRGHLARFARRKLLVLRS